MLYMYFAQGFEETEAIASLDVIRRAGIDIFTVGVGSKKITGAHNITVECDLDTEEATFTGLEGIVLPGGMPGTLNLEKSAAVQAAVDHCNANGIFIGAICAAPSILGHKGLLDGREAIAYPGFEEQLTGARISTHSVAQDGFIITAQGAGAAVAFGLKLVEALDGKARAEQLAASICYPEH